MSETETIEAMVEALGEANEAVQRATDACRRVPGRRSSRTVLKMLTIQGLLEEQIELHE